jgi:hypothetical protein
MPGPLLPYLNVNAPEVGADEDTWGDTLNGILREIDDRLSGDAQMRPDLEEGEWAIDGVSVTATAAEINLLAGVTSLDSYTLPAGLAAFDALTNTGLLVRTGTNTYAARVLTAGDGLAVTNGGGLAGNPLVSVNSSVVRTSRQVATGGGLTGGGDLSANRTLSVNFASQTEAEAGTVADKAMSPLRTAQAITALAPVRNTPTVVTDANAALDTGTYIVAAPHTNAPAANFYRVFAFRSSADGTTQIAFRGGSNEMWYRRQSSNNFGAWSRVIDTDNLSAELRSQLNAAGAAPIYACRAWANFAAVDPPFIRSSGNIASVSRNDVGDYTLVFSTPMPTANLCVHVTVGSGAFVGWAGTYSATSVRIIISDNNTDVLYDANVCNVAVFC